MAVIRTITAERGIDVGSAPSTRVDGSVGEGLRAFGGAVSQAGQTMADIKLARERMDAEFGLRRERMAMEMQEFRTDQEFRRFGDDMSLDFAKVQQEIDPSGEGFTDNVSSQFNAKAEQFLKTVPEAMRPKFAELVKTSREQWINKAAAAEIDQRNTWYREGIVKAQEGLQTQVFNDPELFEAAKQDGYRAIDASGLPQAEKQALREAWDETLSITVGERQVRDAEESPETAATAADRLGVPGAVGRTENGGDAASVLREFEGFRATPYWDVNGHRVGYGSDTVTKADGTVVRVTKGMRISRADGERDLARRVKEFEATARRQVGAREWGALPPNAQAALVSIGYNYGQLPANVVNAVKTGNLAAVANAVEARASDNGGANRSRRMKEAAIIRGGVIEGNEPDLSGDGMDSRYEGLSLEKRLEIFDKTMAAAQRGQTKIDAQVAAAYDAHKGSLELGIETGDVSSERTILSDQILTDAHKADLLKTLRTKQEDSMATAEAIRLFQAGELRVDPYDTEGKKTVDNVYDVMTKSVPPEQLQGATEELVRQTGTVPRQALSVIRQGLTSTNVQEVAEAAEQASRIARVDPAAFERRDGGKGAKDAATAYDHYVNNVGLTKEDAAKRLMDARDPEKVKARAALMDSKPVKDWIKKQATEGNVAAIFAPGWAVDPELGENDLTVAARVGEYQEILQESLFDAGGDQDLAKQYAAERFQRLYRMSSMTQAGEKGILSRLPPEATYNPAADGTHDYIRQQAIETMRAEGVEVHQIYLEPYAETEADFNADRPARYEVWYRETAGGNLERYNLPFFADEDVQRAADAEARRTGLEESEARRQENMRAEEERRARQSGADVAAERALSETVGPDWMKARAAEGARERTMMQPTPTETQDQEARRLKAEELKRQRDELFKASKGQFNNSSMQGFE
jgi:GH24 family phage-related lysozyme (muramidase)